MAGSFYESQNVVFRSFFGVYFHSVSSLRFHTDQLQRTLYAFATGKQWLPCFLIGIALLLVGHVLAGYLLQHGTLTSPYIVTLELHERVTDQQAATLMQGLQDVPIVEYVSYQTSAQMLAFMQETEPEFSGLLTQQQNPFRNALMVTLPSIEYSEQFFTFLEETKLYSYILPTFLSTHRQQQAIEVNRRSMKQGTLNVVTTLLGFVVVAMLCLLWMVTHLRLRDRKQELAVVQLSGGVASALFWPLCYDVLLFMCLASLGAMLSGMMVVLLLSPTYSLPALSAGWWTFIGIEVLCTLCCACILSGAHLRFYNRTLV